MKYTGIAVLLMTVALMLTPVERTLGAGRAPILTNDRESSDEMQTKSANAGEEINWQVLPSGGDNSGTSTNYGLAGTVGQTAAGNVGSTNYSLNHGFWQNFPTGGVLCMAGNANSSGSVAIDDVV